MTNLADDLVQVDQVSLTNNSGGDMLRRLVPWGTETLFCAGSTIRIVARGPMETGEILEISYSEQAISVYGWSGSVVAAYQDGKKLAGIDLPAPRTPRLPN